MSDMIVIDPDGDLILRTPEACFKVCSAALRRASPVFKTMLFGPWRESKPATGDWIVDLPEETKFVLNSVLPIIHAVPVLVKPFVDIDPFIDVLMFADKYDMKEILQPWITNAVRDDSCRWNYSHVVKSRGERFIKFMQVAWDYGLENVIDFALRAIVWSATESEISPANDRIIRSKK
ncbi:hypothetical protein VTJ49DRAFT_1276 [Mycothermus thermophilus]|uniref:BTB domain-containing protein n=1 Tax=Humicola insolens TaxID=85995 RepID=A0ABR3VE34_HUMIN